jgi:hypothetical protein
VNPELAPTTTPTTARVPRAWLDVAFAFVCVFGGLSLPFPGLAQLYVRAHAGLGSLLLPGALASRVALSFVTTAELAGQHPWSLMLLVQPPPPQAPLNVPIDLRALVYLPTACFVALALATPLTSRRNNLKLLGWGLLILEPLLVGLVTLPVMSFLGGTGPVRAFELGLATHTVLQVFYRALVASPSMAYVIPLLVWWALLKRLGFPKSERDIRISKAALPAPRP